MYDSLGLTAYTGNNIPTSLPSAYDGFSAGDSALINASIIGARVQASASRERFLEWSQKLKLDKSRKAAMTDCFGCDSIYDSLADVFLKASYVLGRVEKIFEQGFEVRKRDDGFPGEGRTFPGNPIYNGTVGNPVMWIKPPLKQNEQYTFLHELTHIATGETDNNGHAYDGGGLVPLENIFERADFMERAVKISDCTDFNSIFSDYFPSVLIGKIPDPSRPGEFISVNAHFAIECGICDVLGLEKFQQ